MGIARKLYDWATQKVSSPFAPFWLGVIFLLEVILILPLDAILMLFCMENPKKRFLYASIATIASTMSGIIGFALGYLLWDTIGSYVVGHLISESFFARLVAHYNLYEHWAVLIGSFLPIPFKAISLSAGFCQLALFPFIISVFLARSLRFFLIAELMQRWGPQIKKFVDRHFHRILMALGTKAAITFTFFWALGQ